MPTTMKRFGLDELSRDEKLALASELLESADVGVGVPPLTEAQKAELLRRLEKYKDNPKVGSPWDEVKARTAARS